VLSRRFFIDAFDKKKRSRFMADPFAMLRPSSYDDEVLLSAAFFIEQNSRQFDLLVVLGDLATSGREEDMAVAADVFLENKTKKFTNAALDPRFGGYGLPLLVLPGNHDRYKDDYGTPGCRSFDHAFGSIYQPSNGVFLKVVSRDDIDLAIISADFCFIEGASVPYTRRLGRGAVSDVVLSELKLQTTNFKSKSPQMPVIWALHFSPAEGVSRALILEERERVIELANELDVKHIFCGHTHLRKREVGTHPHIYCAGSLSSIDSIGNHFLHICVVDRNSSGDLELEVYDMKYDTQSEDFIPFPVSRLA